MFVFSKPFLLAKTCLRKQRARKRDTRPTSRTCVVGRRSPFDVRRVSCVVRRWSFVGRRSTYVVRRSSFVRSLVRSFVCSFGRSDVRSWHLYLGVAPCGFMSHKVVAHKRLRRHLGLLLAALGASWAGLGRSWAARGSLARPCWAKVRMRILSFGFRPSLASTELPSGLVWTLLPLGVPRLCTHPPSVCTRPVLVLIAWNGLVWTRCVLVCTRFWALLPLGVPRLCTHPPFGPVSYTHLTLPTTVSV